MISQCKMNVITEHKSTKQKNQRKDTIVLKENFMTDKLYLFDLHR